jgi:preprotein translocase subunit SecB
VDCPTILFPFLRRVLADVIRDGGFPPLLLDPIDFGRLYAQRLAQSQPAAKN